MGDLRVNVRLENSDKGAKEWKYTCEQGEKNMRVTRDRERGE